MTNQLNSQKDERDLLLEAIQSSLLIKTHFELMIWLQGKAQAFLPHEILISAWGDFSLGLVYFDIVSSHPLLRTKNISENTLTPQIIQLFNDWQAKNKSPQVLAFEEGVFNADSLFKDIHIQDKFSSFNFHEMKSVIIHGIKDTRGSHDCLYVLMSKKPIPADTKCNMEILMPFIDCAFRKIHLLEDQHMNKNTEEFGIKQLTSREAGIMELLREGKTNREIAETLDISAFTVKNHLQHIYKKLDAINRSQAVNKYISL